MAGVNVMSHNYLQSWPISCKFFYKCQSCIRRRSLVFITTTQLHSTKPEVNNFIQEMGQSIQEWTKQILWKTVFKKYQNFP